MQKIIIGLACLLSLNLNAQDMNTVNHVVAQMFVASDQGNWQEVEKCFADNVNLDYYSMSGNPAAMVTPAAITTAWKGVLPGFTHTHHQLGNFSTKIDGNGAHVFCYGTATHYLEDEGGNVWTVVGSYDFDLENKDNHWKITSMVFNFKYQDGNETLIQKAIANAQKK